MTEIIYYSFKNTSLGLIAMAATANGICFVEFGDDQPALLTKLQSEFPQVSLVTASDSQLPQLDAWAKALVRFLDTDADLPDLPVDVRGSDFEVLVWNSIRGIPPGEVVGYSQVAANIGRPRAVRAVASACGRNRIGVLIPCHRVLRGDGQLGGYRWGLDRKQALLQAEQARSASNTPTRVKL